MKGLCRLRTWTLCKSGHLRAQPNLHHIWGHTRASESTVAHDNPHFCYRKFLKVILCVLGGVEDLATQAEELRYWLKSNGGAEEPILNI